MKVKGVNYDGLSDFQMKAVAIIHGIHGRDSAQELADKYRAANDAEDQGHDDYELSELVPIPAKCPRCKREFLGRDAIKAPSLDRVCCFYCGPNRSVHLIPHPDFPVIDAASLRKGIFSEVPAQSPARHTKTPEKDAKQCTFES